jgi:hypothetical protein
MTTSRRFSGPFIVMFAMIIAMVAVAGPASAMPYKEQPRISVSSDHPRAGSRLTVCGSGFVRGKRVTVTLGKRTELSSVVANHWGNFCTTIRVPDVTGPQWIVAKGAEGRTASVLIHIIGRDRGHGHGVGDQGVGGSSSVPVKVVPVDVLGVSASSSVPVQVLGVSASSSVPVQVLGVSASSSVPVKVKVAGVSASGGTTAAGSGLAFTGASVIGIGALGGLLLVGGGLMLVAGRRRKVNI